jgi:putative iron-regulated protein
MSPCVVQGQCDDLPRPFWALVHAIGTLSKFNINKIARLSAPMLEAQSLLMMTINNVSLEPPMPARSIASRRHVASALVLLPLAAALACGDEASTTAASPAEQAVVAQYVRMVRANYAETAESAEALRDAVHAFVDAPSAARLAAARTAWLAARDPYGQSEAYRFYEGPIDNEQAGPEPYINGWPLDESFIDYVEGAPETGIIQQTDAFPEITTQLLLDENEHGGEDYLSTGYHAIEFLLWGQDLSADGPGARPYTDYVESDDGPGKTAARRGTYLKLAADLLAEQLRSVADAWSPAAPYATAFTANADHTSLKDMLRGIELLTGKELSGERMNAAIKSGDQEDEHSCFSDNTHRDFAMNARGVENVYYGRYGDEDGPGLDELVREKAPELDDAMGVAIDSMNAAIDAIPGPVDQALLTAAGRAKMKAASDAVVDVHDVLVQITEALTP